MKAVILAGGEGTRLRPLTSNTPKPMMPLANKPMMEHIVSLLALHGFDEIVVTVAFLANQIRDYFGDGSDFGVTMRYATEDTPLGTAGSVRNAADELDDTFLVISGDVLTDFDLTTFVKAHRGVDRVEARREPARVRHRDHPARRQHRTVPREADVGRGVLRHDQHGDLRRRTRGLRLHPRG
jgi:NDP-sugar pyrophosphorylase family protein